LLYFSQTVDLLSETKKKRMEKLKYKDFFNNLSYQLLAQFKLKEMQIFRNLILPSIIEEPTNFCYTHFMTLEDGKSQVFVSADVLYRNIGNDILRDITLVRTYSNRVEMEFYMALLEYEDTLAPNPALTNGVGTREDASAQFASTYVIAYHTINEPNLN
jgi:hypothetical protein